MKRNAIVPYFLIMVMGLVLVFFLSVKGVGDSKEIAQGDDDTEQVVFDPEEKSKSCISCHGDILEGKGNIPGLVNTELSKDELIDVLKNGRNGDAGMMPGGLVAGNEEAMAEWILTLE